MFNGESLLKSGKVCEARSLWYVFNSMTMLKTAKGSNRTAVFRTIFDMERLMAHREIGLGMKRSGTLLDKDLYKELTSVESGIN